MIVNLESVTADVLISMQIEPKANIEAFGINFSGKDGYKDGCELQFIPSKKQAQWNTPKQSIPSVPLITFPEMVDRGPYTQIWKPVTKHPDLLHVPFRGKDFAIFGVEGLDQPFTLDIIVKKQKNGTYILDACIDERRTLITWRTELSGNKIALFARNGKVSFKNVTV